MQHFAGVVVGASLPREVFITFRGVDYLVRFSFQIPHSKKPAALLQRVSFRRVNRFLPVQHFAGVVVGASLPREVLIVL
ncbi:hypothetical protein PPEP_a0008 [Pseudoalteromonas peptidolytica F12-50-A1]|uniref:Uncharacterized protein n=1 Tax=Pseudoalteromonas peptidolytica F12-50-A1 TaxID=1315280 RepID=A0A8I0MTW0_9GAMM|nr:hypothetical protein [Pseudoalteromonas peptidolytica F12-50-A1]